MTAISATTDAHVPSTDAPVADARLGRNKEGGDTTVESRITC